LPMICRRGGIDSLTSAPSASWTHHRVRDFQSVAESFAVKIRRPGQGRQHPHQLLGMLRRQAASEKRSHAPRHESSDTDRGPRQNDKSRDERAPKQHARPHGENGSGICQGGGFREEKRSRQARSRRPGPKFANAVSRKTCIRKEGQKNRGGLGL